ncbi:MAG: APH(3'') family aminoglycoside O-phosphotransferase [Methylorubrum extorquens]|jgi:streptomycin 3"-kinase|uniref:APH(3'') family aminoglycoside O-phosphotransferase n=1 Tax=Methylorubrum extorquens TaxID=408 RepID=UPI002FEE346F
MIPLDLCEWSPIRAGESGDAVYRRSDAAAFAKVAGPGRAAELRGERDRLLWLEKQDIPCPRVLDWQEAGTYLVTSAIPGLPASELTGDDLVAAWPSIVAMVATLHCLDPLSCPFERRLGPMLKRARDVVARGAVNPDFLPDEDRAVRPTTLLARVESELPIRLEDEAREMVVCHGDATMPNLMVEPGTLRCTGFVDLGRLGTADPYADLALMLANASEAWTSEAQARHAFDALFRGLGIDRPDRGRLDFYLRLDPLTWG